MNLKQNLMVFALVLAGVMTLLMPSQVRAAGTASGTDITNSAILDYQVGGVDQAQITSNTATFKVDNKVDLTVVTADGAAVSVAPGSLNQVLTYTVKNAGNTVQDYSLSHAVATGTWGGATDNFDAVDVNIYVEEGTTAGYQSAEDTATYIDELAAEAEIAVYIIADIPLGQVNDDGALYDLIVQTAQGGTASTQGADILSDDSGDVDDPAVVQIVFADGNGSADAAEDGKYSSRDAYLVVSASLGVTKASAVISDPINDTTNPKPIPGAIIEYTVTITNAAGAGASATSITVSDSLNTEITNGTLVFKTDSYGAVNGIQVTAPNINGGAATALTNASDADEGEFTAGNVVSVTGIDLLAGEQATVKFRVEVQ